MCVWGGHSLSSTVWAERWRRHASASHPSSPSPPTSHHRHSCKNMHACLHPASSLIRMRCASAPLERKREGRRAFVEVHFRFHAVLQGRPEIDMILLTGTWIAPVKVHAASISYLETMCSIIARFNLRASRIFSSNLNVSFMQGSQMLSSCNSLKRPGLYCEEERKNLYHCPPRTSKCFIYFPIKSYRKKYFSELIGNAIAEENWQSNVHVADPSRENG